MSENNGDNTTSCIIMSIGCIVGLVRAYIRVLTFP
jgi:hypothetical protein